MRLCDSCRNRKIKEKSIFSDCKIATSEKENLLLLIMGKKNCCPYYEEEQR